MKKVKLNISKNWYNTLLFFIALFILTSTIYLLSALIINTEIYDSISDIEIRKTKTIAYMNGKIVSYIANAVSVIVFLIYISLSIRRVPVGFGFMLIWIVLFIAIGISPHLLPGSHDEGIRLACGIISTIAIFSIIISLCVLAYHLYIQRLAKRREFYNKIKNK